MKKRNTVKKRRGAPFFLKISIIITLVVTLAGGSLLTVASDKFGLLVEENVKSKLEVEAREKTSNLKNSFNLSLNRVDSIGNDPEKKAYLQKYKNGTITDVDNAKMAKDMEAELKLMEGKWSQSMIVYEGVAVVDGIGGKAVGVPAGGAPWYTGTVSSLKKTVGGIMLSPVKEDTPAIAVGYPILNDNGSLLGVYMASMDLRTFSDDLVLEKNGVKTFVIDENGKVILATEPTDIFRYNLKDETYEGEPTNDEVAEFYNEVISNISGVSKFKRGDVTNIASYNKVEADEGVTLYLISYMDENLYLQPINEVTQVLRGLFIACIVFGVIVSLFIANYISYPIRKASEQLNMIADGDYTGENYKKFFKRKDELGDLGKSIEQMQEQTKELIKVLQDKVLNLKETSQVFASAIEQSMGSMKEVAQQTSGMTLRNQSDAASIEEMACSVKEVAQNVSVISEKVDEITINTSSVLSSAKDGMLTMDETVETITNVDNSTEEVQKVFEELKKSSVKINDIVKIINDITRKTNLLAINASIEAARAGSAGKGFAVVADEVRNLAQQSSKSVVEIGNIIDNIQAEITRAGDIINEEKQSVEHGVSTTKSTKEKFEIILSALEENAKQVDEISEMALNQNNISKEMERAINDIATSTNKNANSAEEISTNIDEQAEVFVELSNKTEMLKELSTELEKAANKFKIN